MSSSKDLLAKKHTRPAPEQEEKAIELLLAALREVKSEVGQEDVTAALEAELSQRGLRHADVKLLLERKRAAIAAGFQSFELIAGAKRPKRPVIKLGKAGPEFTKVEPPVEPVADGEEGEPEEVIGDFTADEKQQLTEAVRFFSGPHASQLSDADLLAFALVVVK